MFSIVFRGKYHGIFKTREKAETALEKLGWKKKDDGRFYIPSRVSRPRFIFCAILELPTITIGHISDLPRLTKKLKIVRRKARVIPFKPALNS